MGRTHEDNEWRARRVAAAWHDDGVVIVANGSLVVTWPTALEKYAPGEDIVAPLGVERAQAIWIVTVALMDGYVRPQRALARRITKMSIEEARALAKPKPAPPPPPDEFAQQFQARLRK